MRYQQWVKWWLDGVRQQAMTLANIVPGARLMNGISKLDQNLKRTSLKCAQSTTTKCYTRHDSVTLMTWAIFRCGQPSMLSINTLRNFTDFRIRLKYVSWTGPRFMSPFDVTCPQWVTGKTASVHQTIYSNFDGKINSHQLTYINLTCCDVNAKNAYFSSVA